MRQSSSAHLRAAILCKLLTVPVGSCRPSVIPGARVGGVRVDGVLGDLYMRTAFCSEPPRFWQKPTVRA